MDMIYLPGFLATAEHAPAVLYPYGFHHPDVRPGADRRRIVDRRRRGDSARPRRSFDFGRFARKRVERSRRCLEKLLASGATIYGVNTGFGKLSNQRIEPDEVLALQENLLRSHAVGMGPLLSISVSRLALALRIQSLAKGYSGVSAELLDTLLEMYNRAVVPAIPEQGSVGASGDLAPLAHMALVVMGEGYAFITRPSPERDGRTAGRARPLSGRAALRRARLKPHRPLAKEGLSLINGTQVSTAILADAVVRPPPDEDRGYRRRHDGGSDQEFSPALRRENPGGAAAPRPDRVRRQPPANAGGERDHGVACRLPQGARRL